MADLRPRVGVCHRNKFGHGEWSGSLKRSPHCRQYLMLNMIGMRAHRCVCVGGGGVQNVILDNQSYFTLKKRANVSEQIRKIP